MPCAQCRRIARASCGRIGALMFTAARARSPCRHRVDRVRGQRVAVLRPRDDEQQRGEESRPEGHRDASASHRELVTDVVMITSTLEKFGWFRATVALCVYRWRSSDGRPPVVERRAPATRAVEVEARGVRARHLALRERELRREAPAPAARALKLQTLAADALLAARDVRDGDLLLVRELTRIVGRVRARRRGARHRGDRRRAVARQGVDRRRRRPPPGAAARVDLGRDPRRRRGRAGAALAARALAAHVLAARGLAARAARARPRRRRTGSCC